jgi:dipeptidyl aminopeptidase/acylaminoacyl peptidase
MTYRLLTALAFALVGCTSSETPATKASERPTDSGPVSIDHIAWVDSTRLVYQVTRMPSQQRSIEVIGMDGSRRHLTSGNTPRPSNDGKLVAFVRDDDSASAQLWTIPIEGGQPRQLTRLPRGIGGQNYLFRYDYGWSGDGARIAVKRAIGLKESADRGLDDLNVTATGQPTVVKFGFPDYNPEGQQNRAEIWLVNVSDGANRLVTTDPVANLYNIRWLPGDKQVTYSWQGRTAEGAVLYALRALDLTTGRGETIVDNPSNVPDAMVSPDGKSLLYNHSTVPAFYPPHVSARLVDLATREVKPWLTPHAESSVMGWHPSGRSVYLRVREDTSLVWRTEHVFLTGERHVIDVVGGTRDAVVRPDGRAIVWVERAINGETQLRVAAIAEDGHSVANVRTLVSWSGPAAAADSPATGGRREQITWRSTDGVTANGMLIYPPAFDSTKRYPLAIIIHGGPYGQRGDGWFPVFMDPGIREDWSSHGYVVLAPNYRSDGSASWAALERARKAGRMNRADYDDIISGVDHVVRMGIVDTTRMALMGHSYGSYLTNWIIANTNRFKCAVSTHGTADDATSWGLTNANAYKEWTRGGPPYERWAEWDRESALRNIGGARTPTLFIAGETDGPSPMELRLLYQALRRQGVDARYLLYRGEGHNLVQPANQKHALQSIREWVNKCLQ